MLLKQALHGRMKINNGKLINYNSNIINLANNEALNNVTEVELTVVQKLNQTSSPENGLYSFSGVLFWFFFAQAKKNKEKCQFKMKKRNFVPGSITTIKHRCIALLYCTNSIEQCATNFTKAKHSCITN